MWSQWKQQKQTQTCTGTCYLFSFKHTTFCSAPQDVSRDRIYIWFYFSDHRLFFSPLLFVCIWSSSKMNDLLMLGLLSWKVVFKRYAMEETQCNKTPSQCCFFELQSFSPPPQRSQSLKSFLLVEWSTVKLLRAGRHHCRSDKDQEAWLYCELCGVSM